MITNGPTELRTRFDAVEVAVEKVCHETGRDRGTITLVGVVKKQPQAALEEFVRWCHERSRPAVIGVNYVQEYRSIVGALTEKPDRVHFIGRLQKNKVKDAVTLFDVIETVDSPELAQVIDDAARRIGKIQRVYLQVNISADERKGGFTPQAAREFIERETATFPNIVVEGLMTITKFYEVAAEARPDFRALADLARSLPNAQGYQLSMGMSHDFDIALGEGATFIRLGTALFGERKV